MKQFSAIQEAISSIDIFGQGVEFQINHQTKAKTFIGGIISIVTTTLLFIMFFFSSQDVLYHENPQISIEHEILTKNPNITLDIFTMPISISLTNNNNLPINLSKYFRLEMVYTHGKTSDPKLGEKILTLTNCRKDFFPFISDDLYEQANLGSFLCLDNQNITIGGSWGEETIAYLNLRISMCNDPNECAPQHEIINYINSNLLFWNIYYMNTNINPQISDKPISYNIVNYYKTIRSDSYKISEFYINKQSLVSDDGFILKSKNIIDTIAFDYNNFDDTKFNNETQVLVEFYLMSSNNCIIKHRNYLKMQTVLANVGGMANIIRIFSIILCYTFSIIKRDEILLNQVIEYDIPIKKKNKIQVGEFQKMRRLSNILNNEIYDTIDQNIPYVNNKSRRGSTRSNSPVKKRRESLVTQNIFKNVRETNLTNYDEGSRDHLCSTYKSPDLQNSLQRFRESLSPMSNINNLKNNDIRLNSSPDKKKSNLKIRNNSSDNNKKISKVKGSVVNTYNSQINFDSNFKISSNNSPIVSTNNQQQNRIKTDNENVLDIVTLKYPNKNVAFLPMTSTSPFNSNLDLKIKFKEAKHNMRRMSQTYSKTSVENYTKNNILHFRDPTIEGIGKTDDIPAKQIIEIIKSRKKKFELSFSFCDIIKGFLCFKFCRNEKLNNKKSLYLKSRHIVAEILDISHVFKKIIEFDKLKSIILTEEQIALFNFISNELMSLDEDKMKNHIISNAKLLAKDEEKLVDLILKFKNKIKNKEEINRIDKKLYDSVDEVFKYML